MTRTHHGRERTDEYDWLRASEDPEVLAYLEAENAWTEQQTSHLAALRDTLVDEIKARTQETDLSVPTRLRGWWYYGRSFEGRQYGASCRVPVTDPDDWTPPQPDADARPDAPALPGEEVILDHNALAEGHEFWSMGGSSISPDDQLLAWSVDTQGDELYTVRVKSLVTGELLTDEITGIGGGVTWSPDTSGFWYSTRDDSWRSDKIWWHRLGDPQSADELVYHETDERFFVGVGRSRDNRFVMIYSGSKNTSEIRYLDTQHPDEGWRVFSPRREGLEYGIEPARVGGDWVFLVHHNGTGPDFELGRAPIEPTTPESWAPVVPHRAGVRLEDVSAYADHLVINQRSEGLTQLRILELDDSGIADDHLVEFDSPLYSIGGGSSPTFETPMVRLGYTTMATPQAAYDYHVPSRTLHLRKATPVLGGYDPADYEEHRLWATSTDGTLVPISLVVRRDARAAGAVPVHLYGYGAYEASMDPWFSIPRISELDRGAAFAIAHVRGGGEMGRHWYEQGRMEHKQNTFTDFIACARHLVDTGWTTPELIVAEGGSAGGLLMGAIANRAPEVFGGIVAEVPFVDSLTSMLDASLPLTITEYDEWGNPEGDAETYDRLASYAPYDNVTTQDYPPILALTSLHDTRVLYVEPAKWVARLRALNDGAPEVLLKTQMAAGHGGVSGRYRAWEERAFTVAWILDQLGLADQASADRPMPHATDRPIGSGAH